MTTKLAMDPTVMDTAPARPARSPEERRARPVPEATVRGREAPKPASIGPRPGTAPARAAVRAGAPARARDRYRYLLMLRFTLLNVVAVALLAAATVEGLVTQVLAADDTHITIAIFGLFLAGLVLSVRRTWQTSRELNVLRGPDAARFASRYLDGLRGRGGTARGWLIDVLRLKVAHRATAIRHIANTLVLLGLVGTVVGFIIALSGIQPGHAADVDTLGPMLSTMIAGMSTALYTTLVGAVLNMWLMANHQVLVSGLVSLLAAATETAADLDLDG